MSKFCTSCGKALGKGAKFCTGCGAAVSSSPVQAVAAPVQILAAREDASLPKGAPASKAAGKIKAKAKKEVKAYTEKAFSGVIPSYAAAGELALPLELTPLPAAADAQSLFSVLKNGISGLTGGFRRTLGDKKRLVMVIALAIIWLLINLLAALGIFPLPVRVLSWLTAARGSLIGGTVGKGLVAAMLAQVLVDKGMSASLKSGLSQLSASAKGGREAVVPLLAGLGSALIACNMMVSSNLQNTMVCLAAYLLAAKALVQNGFLRRLFTALLPKAKETFVTAVMGGWTLGFALFAAASLLPGGRNGYLLGILLLIAGGVLTIVGKSKKEVAAK